MIRITTRDVGVTQVATVWVGEAKAVEFYTGTRHASVSLEIAEQRVADVLRMLLMDRGNVRLYDEDDY